MSCDCSCQGCGQPVRTCRCPLKKKGHKCPERAYIKECTDCDPCRPCESMVKICSFTAPTLEEAQAFHNSFVYNQEDDSVYYIDDNGTPTRFGSTPMFIDNFVPTSRKVPRQTVYDFYNDKAYIYNPEGEYKEIDFAGLTPTPTPSAQTLEVTFSNFSRTNQPQVTGSKAIVEYTVDLANGENLTPIQIFDAYQNGRKIVFKNIPTMVDNTNYLPVFERVEGGVTTNYGGEAVPTFYEDEIETQGNNVEGLRYLANGPVNAYGYGGTPWTVYLQFEKESGTPVLQRVFLRVNTRVEV